MLEIPIGWKKLPLAEIVKADKPIVYGIVQAGPEHPNGIPYIRSADVGAKIDLTKLARTAPEIAAKYARSTVQPGDIVFSLRGNIGELSIVPDELEQANLTQGTARISVNEAAVPEFVAFALRSPMLQQRIATVGKGSTFKEISLEELRKLQIPMPPLAEQRYIASLLRTWDEAIEMVFTLADRKRKGLIALQAKLVGSENTLPSRWPLRPLSDIATRIRRHNQSNDYPVMTISAKAGFILQSDRYSRDMAGTSLENYTVLHQGEYAYNKGNSLTYPQGCIFQLDRPSALIPHVYFCFALKPTVHQPFFSHIFRGGFLNHQLSRLINAGVRNDGLLNISSHDFFRCKLPVPELAQQKAIAAVLTAANEEIVLLKNQIEMYQGQKRGLMQKLLSGQWRVKV